ncbi:hypothetical protein BDQ17DRAFT_88028 [Cyathus striatus]|nr:hypothetical protein BDQ17DRAFT_88028 [Cyathus striatus]
MADGTDSVHTDSELSVHPDEFPVSATTEYNDTHSDVQSSDDDDEFVYPGAPSAEPEHVAAPVELTETPSPPPAGRQSHPSPAQLESLYAAASSGDLPLLKRVFKNALETGEVEPFGLANDASTRTGFTALHAAASRGYLDMVMWCTVHYDVRECKN